MDLPTLISEFREYVNNLKSAWAKFKRAGKIHKTPAYQKRRTDELTILWTNLSKKVTSIDALLTVADPCYETEKTEAKTLYTEYLAELNKIGGTTMTSTNADIACHLQKQETRFEVLSRNIEDVLEKQSINEEISIAYYKTKIKAIGEAWTRIQIDDENFEWDKKSLPKEYFEKLAEFETLVERSEIFLHDKSVTSNEKTDGVKVQRVTLPTFKGDYFKWVSFRDLFRSIVINNQTLSDAERMQVLKTNLSGEAESLISDLTISNINFNSAWDRLINRYDNNRVVVYKHLNKLIFQQFGRSDSKSIKKLLDTTDQIILALQNLGRPTEYWDDWIVLIISQKLSEECRRDWEKKMGNSKDLPTWHELKTFMEEEFRMLEGLENVHKKNEKNDGKQQDKTDKKIIKSYHTSVDSSSCPACKGEHKLFSCSKFKEMTPTDRWELAKAQKLCFSCLNIHKDKLKCDKKKPCKKCNRRHSTWLHESRQKSSEELTNAYGSVEKDELTAAHGSFGTSENQVLLATTLISVQDMNGKSVMLRALLDSGSQGSMITDHAAAVLQIPSRFSRKHISGLGGNNTGKARMINALIQPRFENGFKLWVDCYILKRLTKTLPDNDLDIKKWKHLKGLMLADPTFHKKGPIDVLLGTDVFANIIQSGFIKGKPGTPIAQETLFGWIISGNISPTYPKNEIKCLVSSHEEEVNLRKFWELEELNPKRKLTPDEIRCEELYADNHLRNSEGIFTVKIPFKDGNLGPERLGQSRQQSYSRFLQLEKRFAKDDNLRVEYMKVMSEYMTLGHMRNVDDEPQSNKLYCIPHHAVIKMESLTTKTRVVFDASAKTSTGWSLNDCMYTGAKQQPDLMNILIKWRKNKIVFKADIEKMYRMIHLNKEDQKYHTIFWRNHPSEKLSEFQMTRVTFGTAAAPFLATRTLTQLAMECKEEHRLAKEVILEDFYVDDLISGTNDVKIALQCKDDLMKILQQGGLQLRKWTSNSSKLLETLPKHLTERSLQLFDEDDTTKALGLQWNPRTDKFSFRLTWEAGTEQITKRQLLSEASRLFDPLGWLAPTVIKAKLIMQEVWLSKIKWDDEVSISIMEKWNQFRKELQSLSKISIERWIKYDTDCDIQLHGFCDASEKAYGAVVYTRIQKDDHVEVQLITAKTRVAPIHLKATLPRLELCGAVLLANLLQSVKESLKVGDVPIIAWSDSMITLGWIKGDPHTWKTFVANRVSDIQSTRVTDWRHIKSDDNPADCCSRGIMPEELHTHELWWTGPKWLELNPEHWPQTEIKGENMELRPISINVATIDRNELRLGISSWFRMVRVMAYILRMKVGKKYGLNLTVPELEAAKTVLYKRCQQEAFPAEITCLQHKGKLTSRSKLLQLNPFLDNEGIMRVGGRLQNAIMSFNNKHPIILPYDHETSKAIVHQMHLDTLHGGPQLMIGLLRKKYWIVNIKRMATSIYQHCVNCRRFNGQTREQLMGNLPKERVTLERSFLHTGLDYAGPIEVRTSKLRNAKIVKGYIAVFVCFGTKAIHLELVSDMTTPAFMAALNRFMARRGMCNTIYSDNGSNFLGASNQLILQEKRWLHERNNELAMVMANKGIRWKFIPPGSPNFGGLWEKGVRSVKDHLKRTLKTSRLTCEEYSTILCQIEACLNSRPLCPLTSDVENLNALTPGHFLVGDALMAPPQPVMLDTLANKVDRWKHLQLLQQHFWNRWNREYLNQLQQRQKWKTDRENITEGELVLLKDEQVPPRNWLMARVMKVHPGTDGKVRVVTLRTRKGEIQRPITKICPLLKEDNMEDVFVPNEAIQEQELHDLGPDSNEQQRNRTENPRFIQKHQVPKTSNGPSTSYNLRNRTSLKVPPRFVMMMAILGLLVMIGGGSAMHTETVKVTKFTNNAGIYFENLGRATIIRTEWHMYIRFRLDQYMYEFKRLQDIIQELQNACVGFDSAMTDSHCEDITRLLNQNVAEIKSLNVLLKSNGEEMNKKQLVRNRRTAPLNFVGWIQHELFGVMATDQAEHIDNQFKLVEQDANHMMKLLKNQTTIVENTVNLMKISQDEINQNYDKISNTIDLLANETNQATKKMKLMGMALFTSVLIHRFETTQRNILDMLTDVHEGHISSYIFTPQQFKEHLEIINNNLPIGSKLPDIANHDFKALYKLIKGRARVTARNIWVDMMIPLVATTEYQVLRVIPIPTIHQGNHITIIPDSEYLLTPLKKDNFYQVNEKDLNTCLKPHKEMFICSLGQPIYDTQSSKSQCERDLLSQKTTLSPLCQFQMTNESNYWIPLHEKNSWIYGLKNQIILSLVCDNNAQPFTLDGAGIIQIPAGCEVTQPGMTLVAETIKQSNGQFNFYPSLNLSEAVTKMGHVTDIKMLNLTIDHNKQLNQIHNQLIDLDQQSTFNTMHHTLHYSGHLGLWIIVICFGLCVWQKRHEIRKRILNYSTPTITDDIEHGGIQHDNQDGNPKTPQTSSDDSQHQQMKSSTVERHKAGECPFRT